jgi:phosphoribosylanthranilate isomerase
MSISVKICGISSEEALEAAIESGADYAGFVFFRKSPRNLSLKRAAKLARQAEGRIKTVALTVNARNSTIAAIASEVGPDFLQLHGRETLARAGAILALTRTPIIKAIKVSASEDISAARSFEPLTQFLLFDAKVPASARALPGGNGLSFDWTLLAGASLRPNFMLSGGLNADNLLEALTASGATAVDVSSGVETSPGVKSPLLIRQFVKIAKSRGRPAAAFSSHYKEKKNVSLA